MSSASIKSNGKRKQKQKRGKQPSIKLDVKVPTARSKAKRARRPKAGISSDPYLRACAAQFVAPAESEGLLVPDSSTAPRAVRRFTSILNFSANDAGMANGFTVITKPNLSAPIHYTGGAARVPSAGYGPVTITGKFVVSASGDITSSEYRVVSDTNGNENGVGTFVPLTHTTTLLGIALANLATANGDITISFDGHFEDTNTPFKCRLYQAKTADAAWAVGGTELVVSRNSPASVSWGVAAWDHLAFSQIVTGGKNHTIGFTITCKSPAQCAVTFSSGVDCGNNGLVQELNSLAQGGRVVGASILVTNTSSGLANGGTITAARMPHSMSPFATIAQIQRSVRSNRFYSGPASAGAYVWWLPSEASNRSFMDKAEALNQLENDDYLWVRLDGWSQPNGSTVRVMINYVVEFSSESPLYEKKAPPRLTPEWERVMHALSIQPACSCNPSHEDFKRWALTAKEYGNKVYGHYKEHQGTYDALFTILAALAA